MTDFNYKLGLDSLAAKNYQKAIEHFTNSLNSEFSSGAHHNRGFAYFNLGNLAMAKIDYEAGAKWTLDHLKNGNNTDKVFVDSCLRDLIDSKSTIATIEMQLKNFEGAKLIYTELLTFHMNVTNKSIIRPDWHISVIYSNRSMANLYLNKMDEAAKDMGAAYVESTSETKKNEILGIAQMTGILAKVKECITVYRTIKK